MTSKTLYVNGLRTGQSPDELAKLFERHGKLVRCDIPTGPRHSDHPPARACYAFVEYEREEDAQRAKQELDRVEFDGRNLAVTFAMTAPRSSWRKSNDNDRHDDENRRGSRDDRRHDSRRDGRDDDRRHDKYYDSSRNNKSNDGRRDEPTSRRHRDEDDCDKPRKSSHSKHRDRSPSPRRRDNSDRHADRHSSRHDSSSRRRESETPRKRSSRSPPRRRDRSVSPRGAEVNRNRRRSPRRESKNDHSNGQTVVADSRPRVESKVNSAHTEIDIPVGGGWNSTEDAKEPAGNGWTGDGDKNDSGWTAPDGKTSQQNDDAISLHGDVEKELSEQQHGGSPKLRTSR